MDNIWKAFFAGDVLITKDRSSSFIGDDLQKLISDHDIISCNFEGPLFIKDSKPIPKAFSVSISQHHKAADIVKNAGFNIISLANNHIYDYGQTALENTLNAFNGQLTVGAGADFTSTYELKQIEINGVKVGFLSFCESEFGALTFGIPERGGYAWINHPSVNYRIITAKEEVDILIIQLHAGPEKVELPLPEWRQRYREFIDLGADLIIGHHPHVPQGWEVYHDKLIFYSLGNFYFDIENSNPNWTKGYGVSLTYDGTELVNFEIIPVEKTAKGTDLNKNQSFRAYLDYLCKILDPELYFDLADKQAVLLWENRYQNCYLHAINAFPDKGLWKYVKKVLFKYIKEKGYINNLSILHNIRIESHRWSVERALSLIEEKKKIR